MKSENFYLGLDIGTDSVGYAVTNDKYDIIKRKGDAVWGVTLFDEANLCNDRRGFRTERRRLDRRQNRICLLQGIFASEIAKADRDFFTRIKNSALWRDDAGEPYSVFNDKDYTDVDYHKAYPTVHHLITELMSSKEPHDVRLVYIALAWLTAHRGHFLNEISKDNLSELTDFNSVYKNLIEWFNERELEIHKCLSEPEILAEVLRQKLSVSKKFEMLRKRLNDGKKIRTDEAFPVNAELILKLLCGSRISVKDMFFIEHYEDIGSFSLDSDDEVIVDILSKLSDDESELIKRLKAVYDWVLLVDILNGKSSISEAKVCVYEQHRADLAWLKDFIRSYNKEMYIPLFKDEKSNDNYSAYRKSNNSREAFFKRLTAILKKITPNEKEKEKYDDALNRIGSGKFLPKQVNADNRVIPYQLYWSELDMILRNAQGYLPFLSEKDSDGFIAADKIRSVFEFRVPYFVGPLNGTSSNAWLVRKEKGIIYPWNISDKIDLDLSESEFILRMTGKCTYLHSEDVLPKNSLCYHRFTVLNEINNIRINNEPISVSLKQKIYTELFMAVKKVTRKKLENYLRSNGCLPDGAELDGIDEQINSDLSPQHDFKRLLNNNVLSETEAEEIILRITTTDSRKRLEKWLYDRFPRLSEADIRYISGLRYKDFGRLSERFLKKLEGTVKNTGENITIMQAMWETNHNLMELLSDNYTFAERIEEENREHFSANPLTVSERLDEMYVSNAVKRPIIRTLDIVNDVVKVMGKAPEKIFIEMSRGADADQKNTRTEPRVQQILRLYEKCSAEDVAELKKQLEEMGDSANTKLQSKSLFLYYMQLGKCMYTGNPIELSELGTKRYDIDHIYPQSAVKDDSILNNLVLVESEANGAKGNKYPIDVGIQHKMGAFWNMLCSNGLITKEKYKRLTRNTPFSADEKWGFINRQMTETRQSTKAAAVLLKELYPDTEIVYVKAALASEFRQEFGLLKSRTFNDLHHAKDAYLNIVTGNVYNSKFTKQWFYASPDREYNVKPGKLYTNPVKCGKTVIWDGVPMLEKVKKNVMSNHAHMTCYAYCRKGGFFDQMPVSGTDNNGKAVKGLIPRKKELCDTVKYGGYRKPAVSFFILAKYTAGKETDVMLVPVLLLDGAVTENEETASEYAKQRISEIIGKEAAEISFPLGLRKIKINTVFSLDGFRVCLTGNQNYGKVLCIQPFMPFKETHGQNLYIKALERLSEKVSRSSNYMYDKECDTVNEEQNLKLYDLYINKLENSVYVKRPSTEGALKTLKDGRAKFQKLNIFEQTNVLLAIHQLFGRLSGGCNLELIGGKKSEASSTLNSRLSNWKKYYSDVRIIDSSASGLFETRSVNLLELL